MKIINTELGKLSQLEVVKQVDFSMYLDGGEGDETLLSTCYVPKDCRVGDQLNVFLYLDNEERLIATTLIPLVRVGEFVCLEVSWVNQFGIFLNRRLMKGLFVPLNKQEMKMQIGNKYVIHVYINDEGLHIVASAKVNRYLPKEKAPYQPGEEVNIPIWQKTDLRSKATIENVYSGLLYDNEIFQALYTSDTLKMYIKQVREDGKIDLILQKPGLKKVDDFLKTLYRYIADHGGRIGLNDKSPAKKIYDAFGVSKETFKRVVGDLYKKRLILLHENRTELVRP